MVRFAIVWVLALCCVPVPGQSAAPAADTLELLREFTPSAPASPARPKGMVSGFVDYTPNGSQPGLTHGIFPSGNCRACHAGAPFQLHTPRNSWLGSMMANASRDPVFWAALDVANADGDFDIMSGGHQTFSPNYQKTTTRQRARSAQLSLRVAF